MTDTFSTRQVDGCDLVGGEENSVLAVFRCRPDGKAVATECLRDFPWLALETDVGLGGRYGAHDLVAVVFRLRQKVGQRPFAGLVSASRRLLGGGFWRPVEMLDFAP